MALATSTLSSLYGAHCSETDINEPDTTYTYRDGNEGI